MNVFKHDFCIHIGIKKHEDCFDTGMIDWSEMMKKYPEMNEIELQQAVIQSLKNALVMMGVNV
jgi:hypothetical protein